MFVTHYFSLLPKSLQMSKIFKYQKLMEEKGIIEPCPCQSSVEYENPAFRFGHSPIEAELNFLPNYTYNEEVKAPPRKNSKKDNNDTFRCGMCGLSFFHTKEYAKEFWEGLGEPVHEILKYTHVLYGNIEKDMGVAYEIEKPHFLFYEYEGVELRPSFQIIDVL